VSVEELAACEEKYNKSKLVHSIMRHVAETQDVDLVHLYSVVAWPLYKLYGHAYDAFKVRSAPHRHPHDTRLPTYPPARPPARSAASARTAPLLAIP
jgi:translation initiation factor 2 alpha subunit (eIF-2alpha)